MSCFYLLIVFSGTKTKATNYIITGTMKTAIFTCTELYSFIFDSSEFTVLFQNFVKLNKKNHLLAIIKILLAGFDGTHLYSQHLGVRGWRIWVQALLTILSPSLPSLHLPFPHHGVALTYFSSTLPARYHVLCHNAMMIKDLWNRKLSPQVNDFFPKSCLRYYSVSS